MSLSNRFNQIISCEASLVATTFASKVEIAIIACLWLIQLMCHYTRSCFLHGQHYWSKKWDRSYFHQDYQYCVKFPNILSTNLAWTASNLPGFSKLLETTLTARVLSSLIPVARYSTSDPQLLTNMEILAVSVEGTTSSFCITGLFEICSLNFKLVALSLSLHILNFKKFRFPLNKARDNHWT